MAYENERCEMLKAKKSALESLLLDKLNQLRHLCLKEADITGVIPSDIAVVNGLLTPLPRRRTVSTSFALSPAILSSCTNSRPSEVTSLKLTLEILQKQLDATIRLCHDKTLAHSVRLKHRQTYRNLCHRMQTVEKQLRVCDAVRNNDDVLTMSADVAVPLSVPPDGPFLDRCESAPKLEVKELEQPLRLRSYSRSASSSSLTQLTCSTQPLADIKLYRRLKPKPIQLPHSNVSSHVTTESTPLAALPKYSAYRAEAVVVVPDSGDQRRRIHVQLTGHQEPLIADQLSSTGTGYRPAEHCAVTWYRDNCERVYECTTTQPSLSPCCNSPAVDLLFEHLSRQ